jgi:hypothetical protein
VIHNSTNLRGSTITGHFAAAFATSGGVANKRRIVRRAARCSGGFKSLWLSDEESHIQRRG